MSRIGVLLLMGLMSLYGLEPKIPPALPSAADGQSVYVPPPLSVDIVEEGCVQKEDQNSTGYGSGK